MKCYHLIFGQYLEKTIPIIIEQYSIAGILLIGAEEPNLSFLNVQKINLNPSSFNNPILLASAIINEIERVEITTRERIQVAIVGTNPLEILSLYMVAQSLNSSAYTIIENNIILLPPLNISKITGDELKILNHLSKAECVDSMGELVERLEWGKKENPNMIAKVAYCVRKLRSKKLIDTLKEGRTVQLKITDAGKQHVQLFGNGIVKLKEED